MTTYRKYDDPELIRLLQNGDERAFVAVYRRYWPVLFDSAWRRLKDRGMAEDVVQEIFVDLWTRRASLSVSRLGPYLQAAVRYKTLNYLARGKGSRELFEPMEQLLALTPAADAKLMERELSELVQLFIRALPGKRRKIFELYYTEDLSTLEIADRLQVSRKTVQNQLRTAVIALKAHLTSFIFLLFTI
ncbi:MAG TPA: sigma-70 family RNA polymerase sigma factor [Anseongella sp.]